MIAIRTVVQILRFDRHTGGGELGHEARNKGVEGGIRCQDRNKGAGTKGSGTDSTSASDGSPSGGGPGTIEPLDLE